ncbi:MAG: hypothetical protein QOI10_2908 [Solirubrobacterales bacterium]|jgi:hypothetical protein|nr:hypothetical protein [Solirubrobacterales bacterium]
MKAEDWAQVVQGLAAKRGATYEPIGGLNPKGGPATLCPGGTNRIKGELASQFWGASCDSDEHEEGGLFSKTVLPRSVLAKAHMPDLAQVVPMFNVESIEAGERVEQLASRRKVEFESIAFNKRYLATVPADHDPIALRELFSPGFLDWAAQIDNEVEFGITDRQLYFSWHLAERTAEVYGTALDTAAGLFMRLRNEMEESGVHTYQPGPWHAGLEPFPDATA